MYIYIYMYVSIYIYTYKYVYIYIYIYDHIRIYIYMNGFMGRLCILLDLYRHMIRRFKYILWDICIVYNVYSIYIYICKETDPVLSALLPLVGWYWFPECGNEALNQESVSKVRKIWCHLNISQNAPVWTIYHIYYIISSVKWSKHSIWGNCARPTIFYIGRPNSHKGGMTIQEYWIQ